MGRDTAGGADEPAGHRARNLPQRGALGRVEDDRLLEETACPPLSGCVVDLPLDHARDERLLALALHLIGDDQATLARLKELERFGLHVPGLEEPAGRFGHVEHLCPARDERWIRLRGRARRRGDRRAVEAALPAREARRCRRPEGAVERERFGDESARDLRRGLEPRELLIGAQGRELAVETLTGDASARDLENARRVVDDQRAELETAECAVEENPHRARAAPVDGRHPCAHRAFLTALDHGARRRSGRGRDATLRETIERALGRASHATVPAIAEGDQNGKRVGALRVGELTERAFERRRRSRREDGEVGGGNGPACRERLVERAAAGL